MAEAGLLYYEVLTVVLIWAGTGINNYYDCPRARALSHASSEEKGRENKGGRATRWAVIVI